MTERAKRIVKIEWIDSKGAGGWIYKDDFESSNNDHPCACISVGMVVSENKKSITLAQSIGDDPEQYDNTICIPKCCIKKKQNLSV